MIPIRSLLTIQQAAQVTGISVPTLYKWVGQRKIPHIKLGRLVKFHPTKLEEWIKQQPVISMPERGLRLSNSRLLVGLPHARSQRPEYSREGDSLPGQLGR